MNKKISLLALALVFVLTLAACGGEKYEAQAINEETDVCVICKMAIKDDQYATQIITKEGQSLKFDDIGCLNTWKKENGTETIGAAFVRDFDSKQWLRYEKAYYAYDPTFQTPMAYGIVSFEKEEDAKAYIAEQGKGTLMSADDLASHSWAVNHEMMDMHGHDHGEESGTHDGGGHAS
ncbi:nitrous oxide reductase accessory protein NosL [Paenibacillus agaridevorans]|uniref:nitrous oxide reductase accessory protein NosL n=1 Tax=Paenibacillus agaridevorans TaxID=171404 RepID=UPI001BE4CE1E|nr:nitrous oxide reductase accessory protein NosL [Paenibacillus agaridevorans]